MMPMIRRHLLLTTLGAAALATTLSSNAYAGPGEGEGHARGHRLERFCSQAKCSESQREELHKAFKEFRTDAKADHEKIGALHRKLVAEFAKDKPDEKAMKRLYTQIDQIQRAIVDRRHDMLMEVHGILDAKQRKLAAEKLLAMHGGPGKHAKPRAKADGPRE